MSNTPDSTPDDPQEEAAIEVTITARCDWNGNWSVSDDRLGIEGCEDSFSGAVLDYAYMFRSRLDDLWKGMGADSISNEDALALFVMLDMESGEPL